MITNLVKQRKLTPKRSKVGRGANKNHTSSNHWTPERLMNLSQGEKWNWKLEDREKVFIRNHWFLQGSSQTVLCQKTIVVGNKSQGQAILPIPGCELAQCILTTSTLPWPQPCSQMIPNEGRGGASWRRLIFQTLSKPHLKSPLIQNRCPAEVADCTADCPFLRDSRMAKKNPSASLEVLGRQAVVPVHRRPSY